jgi:hypothetical protein
MKEVKQLRLKAVNSLLLAIDHYNRINDTGRTEAVLFFLIHAFEMLLKAGILHRGGDIRSKDENKTITFDESVRRALSTGNLKFLDDDQALLLATINGHRNAAAHHLLTLSEDVLYLEAQSAITLFRDLLSLLFDIRLEEQLPARVLPLSTVAPSDPTLVFRDEVESVRKLLAPGLRRRDEAEARIKAVVILENALLGIGSQPNKANLQKLMGRLRDGERFEALFPAVSAVTFTSTGERSTLALRFSKKEGIDVRYVPEGTEGVGAVFIKKVHDLDYYTLSHTDLRTTLGINSAQVTNALIALDVKNNEDLARDVMKGNYRYSPEVLDLIRSFREEFSDEDIRLKVTSLRNKPS